MNKARETLGLAAGVLFVFFCLRFNFRSAVAAPYDLEPRLIQVVQVKKLLEFTIAAQPKWHGMIPL